jgi:hypothetical protein
MRFPRSQRGRSAACVLCLGNEKGVQMLGAARRRLTFSNVIAVIALFVALGGSVYAANKISGKTIKKGSEPGNRLKKNSVTGTQVKESTLGAVPNADALGGASASAYQGKLLSAVVASDGTLAGGVGAVSSNRGSGGRYTVKFNRDITSCALVSSATTPAPNPGPGLPGSGMLLGYAAVTHLQGAADSVYVRAGNDGTPDADTPFTVLVAC